MKEINLIHTNLQLTQEGILIIRCKDEYHYEIEDVKELHEAQKEITEGKKIPTVTIIGKFTEASKEALEFIFSEKSIMYASKDAFVVNSLSQKIIGNFYLKVKKPSIPTRLFNNEKLAFDWLKKHNH
jgi:hypothetical protein